MEQKPVGIIGAMAVEVEKLLPQMENRCTERVGGMDFHIGTLFKRPCVVVQCGVGKVCAAVCSQILISRFQVWAVLNTGVAGGIGDNMHTGELLVATGCVQHDMNTTAAGDEPGAVSLAGESRVVFPCDDRLAALLAEAGQEEYGHIHQGIVASGDLFVAKKTTAHKIRNQFQAMACEMESAAIAQACYMNQIPCGIIRAISDNADDDGTVDFMSFVQEAAEKSAQIMLRVIEKL